MRVLICSSAYKGSLSCLEVAQAIEEGISSRRPDVEVWLAPIADGGDGTVDALAESVGGAIHTLQVRGPLDFLVDAKWLSIGDQAVVELASASGLGYLTEERRDAMFAHTFGLGTVIKAALSTKVDRLTVCVGGSASTDGGAGALVALGARFTDKTGSPLPLGGGPLIDLASCDLSALKLFANGAQIAVAVDVTNPLCGKNGAAYIYGPQKGASADQVKALDRALEHFADLFEIEAARRVRDTPGAGAAGGTAFGIACGLGASIIAGFSWIARMMNLEQKIKEADLVITAEGSLDEQSLFGKATGELAKLCQKHGRPLWALPAVAQANVDWTSHGIDKVVPVATPGCFAQRVDLVRQSNNILNGV